MRCTAAASLVLVSACAPSLAHDSDPEMAENSSTEAEAVDGSPDGPCANDDVDGDGYASVECGGADCDDSDSQVHPGAPDGWSELDFFDYAEASEGPVRIMTDADDALHVLTYDDFRERLRYFWSPDGEDWETRESLLIPAEGWSGSLQADIDASGTIRIVAPPYSIEHDTEWSIETVDGLRGYSSVYENEVVVMERGNELWRNGGDGWVLEPSGLDETGPIFALDHTSTGALQVLFHREGWVWFARRFQEEWVVEQVVARYGQPLSPRLFADDETPQFLRTEQDDSRVELGRWRRSKGTWEYELIESYFGFGSTHSAQMTPAELFVLSVRTPTLRENDPLEQWGLQLYRTAEVGWSSEFLPDGHSALGSYDLAVTSDGAVHIAYSYVGKLWYVFEDDDGIDQNCDGM